jgi:hypothetical protein
MQEILEEIYKNYSSTLEASRMAYEQDFGTLP